MKKSNVNYNYGWICPRCGKVLAPNVKECTCTNNKNIYKDSNLGRRYSLYENKPVFLTYKYKEIIENTKPLSKRFGEEKEALPISKRLEEGKKALKEFKPNKMDVQTYNTKFIPQCETAICFIQNLQHTLEGKCDKESLRQLQIIGWNEETKKFISDALNLYKEKVVKELNELSSISNKSEKKEENNMENYIVINGQKLELTEEQLKQLGIEVEKKRNNPFNNEINKYEDMPYYMIDHTDIESGVVTEYSDGSDFEKTAVIRANSFNDKDFANQVYLHELLARKLLKYAYDNQAGDCEWGDDYNHRYYIYFDYHFNKFMVSPTTIFKELCVYFSSEKIAKQAIKDVVEPFIETHKEFVW